MKFVCQNCQSRYHVDDSKVVGRILRIRCKRCAHIITVRKLESPQSAPPGADQGPAGTGGEKRSADQSVPPPPVHKAQKVDYDHLEELQWFYSLNGQSFGPFNEDDLIAKCLSGQLGDETFVWNAGMDTWRPVMEVPVFAPAIMEAIRRLPQTPTLEVSDPGGSRPTPATPPGIPGTSTGGETDAGDRSADLTVPPSLSLSPSRPSGPFEPAAPSLRQLTPSLGVPPVKSRRVQRTPTSPARTVDAAEDASLERLRALRARLLGATTGEHEVKKPAPPRLVTGSRPAPKAIDGDSTSGRLEPSDTPKAPGSERPGSRSGTFSAPLPSVDSVDPWFEPKAKADSRLSNESGAEYSLDTRDLAAVTVDSIPQDQTPTPLPAVEQLVEPPAPPEQDVPEDTAETDLTEAQTDVEGPPDDESAQQSESDESVTATPDVVEDDDSEPPTADVVEEAPPEEVSLDEPADIEAKEPEEPEEPEELAVEPAGASKRETGATETGEPVTGEIETGGAAEDDEDDESAEELFDELLFFEEGEILGETELSDSLPTSDEDDLAERKVGGETLKQIVAVKRRKHVRLAVAAVVLLAAALTVAVVWKVSEKPAERVIPAAGVEDPDHLGVTADPEDAVTASALERDVESLNLATAVNLARSEIRRASTPSQDLAAVPSPRHMLQTQGDRIPPETSEEHDAGRDLREHSSRSSTTSTATLSDEGTDTPRTASTGVSNSIFSELGGRTVSVEREPSRIDTEAAYQQDRGHSNSLEPDYFDEDLPRVRRAVERCHGVQLRDQSGVQIERVVLVLTVQPDGVVSIDMDPELAQTTFGRCLQSRDDAWNFRNFEGEPVTLTRTYTLQ